MVVSEERAMEQKSEDAESGPNDATDEKQVDPPPSAMEFHPIKIKGEPLSATILRERRERSW
jgi:hypothetical protein